MIKSVAVGTDLIIAQNDGDETFYKIDPDTLHLSCFINWVFTDLERSYEEGSVTSVVPCSCIRMWDRVW